MQAFQSAANSGFDPSAELAHFIQLRRSAAEIGQVTGSDMQESLQFMGESCVDVFSLRPRPLLTFAPFSLLQTRFRNSKTRFIDDFAFDF